MTEYICYVLASRKNPDSTYVGITNNFKRRLRQHNGEITGGAKYTNKKTLRPWYPIIQVHGFREKTHALQFEWAMKHRRKGARRTGRCKTLEFLLGLDRWTKRAPRVATLQLSIHVFMSQQSYCKLAKLTVASFKTLRESQSRGITWRFGK